jgi:uncharacterized protein involved in response to NO
MNTPLLNIDDPDAGSGSGSRIALFDLGFRPFFLFAGIAACLLIPAWLYAYASGHSGSHYYTAVTWHSHEMIFGYTVAVIAGFLLTAVRNWTGMQTPGGMALGGLVLLWLLGRVLPLFSGTLPDWGIALVDVAFLPVLAVTLSVPVIRRRQKHNLVFLFVLTALTVANMMVHLQLLGSTQATATSGSYFAVYLVVLLIAILGGRVIPFFTEKGIAGGVTTRQWKPVEALAFGSLIVLILLELTDAPPVAVMLFAILAAIGHGIRLFGWYRKGVWKVPLLWVLHLGYAWLVAGFILLALSAAGLVNQMPALHAFTAGGIGTITLGMMARVSLGHTGRTLHVGVAMTRAFILVTLAGISRVFLPVIDFDHSRTWIVVAGIFWTLAFAIFVLSYARVLIQPRVDGRPG